jgi:hypothetical protein
MTRIRCGDGGMPPAWQPDTFVALRDVSELMGAAVIGHGVAETPVLSLCWRFGGDLAALTLLRTRGGLRCASGSATS